jgi:hypothetical protein
MRSGKKPVRKNGWPLRKSAPGGRGKLRRLLRRFTMQPAALQEKCWTVAWIGSCHRPHPVWRDIEYSIRGDVRKFLKLKVGDELNPQFLFSSGQRRATGLAFLLSVNLSLAWSRWSTIMLDDPVQHVDDFRTVHLAELAAQLVAEGRQIVCAVEDAALAELLCRRLPVREPGAAKRITMGPDENGDLTIASEKMLPMLPKSTFFSGRTAVSTGHSAREG